MTDVYQRTTTATQGDTLDAIAHRYYAENSQEVLPQLIEDNPQFAPVALLPFQAVIVLPDISQSATATSIKLWD